MMKTKLTRGKDEISKLVYESGCFTKLKQIAGASLSEIEIRLGFRRGRLSQGAYIVQASELPGSDQFDLIGYTNVPADEFKTNGKYDNSKADAKYGKLDHAVFKKNIVLPSWEISGPDSLVKVVAVIEHSNSETYPYSPNPVSQWMVNEPIRCKVIAFIPPNGRFTLSKY